MDIIIASDNQLARQIWSEIKPHVAEMKNMHGNLHKKVTMIADKMGDAKISKILLKISQKNL